MSRFTDIEPTLENYWRGVILFGLNVASYKFALGKSLLDLSKRDSDFVSLQDLGERFSFHIAQHVKTHPKQSTRKDPVKFFELCKEFNQGTLDKSKLVDFTVKHCFDDVIDRFHIVNREEIPKRFYVDERRTNGGIRLTENAYELLNLDFSENLEPEVEARWRLVETAWGLNISRNLISVAHDLETETLFVDADNRRIDITSSRDALNGYQKSKCFYCYGYISICSGSDELGHVDHFFPHTLKQFGEINPMDGVWNLVLACPDCNGSAEKGAKIPSLQLLERLDQRNEYLIGSNHPLKETLILQTGKTDEARHNFLQKSYGFAKKRLLHQWDPAILKGDPTF